MAPVTMEIVHTGSLGIFFCLLWTLYVEMRIHTVVLVFAKDQKVVQPVCAHLLIYILCNLAMVFERKQD